MRQRVLSILLCLGCLFLSACELEDELALRADGSGTYRLKILVEKEFGNALAEFRSQSEKDGYRIVGEGETETRKFLVISKEFKDVAELNDSGTSFALSTGEGGFMRREYRLRAHVASVAANGFKHRFTIVMPAGVTTASAGELHGRRVTWDCAAGGTIDIAAEGFVLPLAGNQALAGSAVILLIGLLLLLGARRRRESVKQVSQA